MISKVQINQTDTIKIRDIFLRNSQISELKVNIEKSFKTLKKLYF